MAIGSVGRLRGRSIEVFFPERLVLGACSHSTARWPFIRVGLLGLSRRIVPNDLGFATACFSVAGIERRLAWIGQFDRSFFDPRTCLPQALRRGLSRRCCRLRKWAARQHKDAAPAGWATQSLVAFRAFTANSVSRTARDIEVLNPPLGLGSEFLKEPSCSHEKLQGSPLPVRQEDPRRPLTTPWGGGDALLERLDCRALIAVDFE
jgi:hypothetical protein